MRGSSVGFRGGRGGAFSGNSSQRGRGGGRGGRGGSFSSDFMQRGRGAGRGGGDRGGFRGATRGRGGSTPERASKVPAFPVISGGSSSSAPKPQKEVPRPQYGSDDDDEDAPPVAVSARRTGRGEVEDEFVAAPVRDKPQQQQRHVKPQQQQQQRGVPRGGNSSGSSGRVSGNVTSSSSAPAARANEGLTRVITTVMDNGTEVPMKLNNRVFIDGLPYNYDEPGKPSLEDELIQFALAWKVGKPIRLIKRSGQGFGFLVLQSPNSVSTAVRVLNGRKFLGRTLRVEEPKPRDMEAVQDIAGLKDVGKTSFTRQVLLTDLPKVAQPEIIREVLRDVAPQLEKKLETIKMTSNNRKAFLTFEAEEDVDPALNFLDGYHLLGRKVAATRAAAPGSLPYSHTPPPRSHSGTTVAVGAGVKLQQSTVDGGEDDEEAIAIVPLGAAPATPTAKGPVKLASTAAATAAAKAASNVTGRTEKYNLLDDGPAEVFVGNVGDEIAATQLRQHFAPCGKIKSCEVLVHPETRLSTGIARIVFALPAYAAYAQEKYHGSRLRGCVLRVDRGEEASAPLTMETAADEEEEEYDEDAYLRRYGVTDKAEYFKGTSVAKEVDIDEDEDGKSRKRGRKTEAESGPAKKKAKMAAAMEKVDVKKADKKSSKLSGKQQQQQQAANHDGEEDEDDDMGFVVSSMFDAAGGEDNAEDSDEEHFFDVDNTEVPRKGGSELAGGKGKKKKKNDAIVKKTSGMKKKR